MLKYVNHINQTIQHEPKLPKTNVQYLRPEVYFYSFQVRLNDDVNIEPYAMHAVLLHVLCYQKCSLFLILCSTVIVGLG